MTTSKCRSCQAEIIWAITATGKKIPLDAEPAERPTGLFRLEERDDQRTQRVELHAVSAAGEPVYLSHFATCPNAAQHRRAS